MTTTYILRSAARADNVDTWEFEDSLELSTTSAASQTATAPSLATSYQAYSFMSAPGVPGVLDHSGSMTVGLDVTAAGANTSYVAYCQRLGSDQSSKGLFGAAQTKLSGTGLKTFTFTVTNPGLPAPASDDLFAVRVAVANANMMSAESITLQLNTTNSYVTAPWEVRGPQRPSLRLQAVGRAASF